MMPIHERIRSDIEGKILGGELRPGDRLPIERELMQQYDCSRMTVNKAITHLAGLGLVERRRKAGSFVARPRTHAMVLDIPDLASEVRDRGQDYRFRLVHREVRETLDSDCDLQIAGRVLYTIGVHLSDGVPFCHETRAVSLSAVPDINQAVFDPEGPGTWLLRNVPWTEAETRLAARPAGAAAELLHIDAREACLSVMRRTWRGDEDITAVRQVFPGDSYSLLARFGSEKQ